LTADTESRGNDPEVIEAEVAATAGARANTSWVIIALVGIGVIVSLAGVVLAASVVTQPDMVNRELLGQIAVMGIVGGGGAVCIGIGCLLFGWLGGSPYVPVGSHRSIIASTTLAVIMGLVIGVGYLKLSHNRGGDTGELLSILSASVYGMFIVMVYLQGVRTGLVNRVTLGLSWAHVPRAVLAAAVAAVAIVIFAGINGLVLQALGIKQPQAEAFSFLQGRPIWEYSIGEYLAALTVVVIAPCVEELFFRGYVFNAYWRTKGPITAYISSALLFSMIHGYPALIVAIFGMGLILAYSYRKTGSIITPILAHVANNAFAFVALINGVQ